MKRIKQLVQQPLALFFGVLGLFAQCSPERESGSVVLHLTDAPLETEGITGLYVTISQITYQIDGQEWATFTGFEGPQTFNLLDLTGTNSVMLGEFETGAGNFTGLRFILDAPDESEQGVTEASTYLEFADGRKLPLRVPSGNTSGFKVQGGFQVSPDGQVEVTVDFDARKSLVRRGNRENYILTPVMRSVVNSRSGNITGYLDSRMEDYSYVVMAYESGTFRLSETVEGDECNAFPNAVTSSKVAEDGYYELGFLNAGQYDLIIASFDNQGMLVEVLGQQSDVTVSAKQDIEVTIDIASL